MEKCKYIEGFKNYCRLSKQIKSKIASAHSYSEIEKKLGLGGD